MEYSKSNSNNCKGLKITTGTNICKVNNWSFGEVQSQAEKERLLQLKERVVQRHEDKKMLLQLKESLLQRLQIQRLQRAKHIGDIRNNDCSYIKDSKTKSK